MNNPKTSSTDYFDQGFYCAESVLMALAESRGFESDLIPGIATGFCSGVARTGGICGALSGAIMAINVETGRKDAGDSLAQNYRLVQALLTEFEQEHSSTNCRDLLGCDLGTPEGQEYFKNEELHHRCRNYTQAAENIAHTLLSRMQSDSDATAEAGGNSLR